MPKEPRNKLFGNIPLRLVLILPFVTQIALAVGLVGYLSFRNGQRAVNNVAHQLRSEISARITEHLHTFLDTPHRINQINAQALRQEVLDADDPAALERYLWEQIQAFESVTSIYFGNTEGGLVDAGREGAGGALYVIATDEFRRGPFKKYATDDAGNRTELLTTVPDFDARTRAWYTNAVAKGDASWSDIYILFTGQDMAIAASRPVYDEQQNLLGVVSSDIFVSHIADFMKALDIGETGVGFIVERSGLLVASSTDEQPFTEPDEDGTQRRLYARESAAPTVRRAAEFLRARFGDYHAISSVQHLEFEVDGQRQFLQVTSVRDKYGIDWLVVVVIPESDFMEQINANNRTTGLLIVAALFVAVVGGVVTAQWITGPISRLNTSTQAMARGAWDQTAHKEWISEIDALAQSFNGMVEQLKQTLDSLASEIAERKRAESALQKNITRYEDLVGNVPVGIYIVWIRTDGTMSFEYVSDRWCEMHQITRQAVLADSSAANALVHPDEREDFFSQNQKAYRSQTPFSWKGRFIIGGETRWLRLQSIPTVMENGDVRWFGMTQDITEIESADRALKASEERFRGVFETSPTGIAIVDTVTQRFLEANNSFLQLVGYSLEELQHLTVIDVTHPEDWDRESELVEAYLNESLPVYTVEKRYIRKDGEIRWVHTTGDVLVVDPDAPPLAIANVEDITVRKQTEESLRKSKRRLEKALAELKETQEQMMQQERLAAVGQLSAGIAHEFNNILAPITLYTRMSLRGNDLPPTIRRRLQVIAEQADHATKLVQRILDFGRRAVFERKPLDMDALLEKVILLLKETLPPDIHIDLTMGSSAHVIHADSKLVQQAVVNLALNARDAMPEGGELHIALFRVEDTDIYCIECGPVVDGAWVQVEVRDSGAGIPPDVLPHIFEPFFTTRAPLGQGLGLAQVYGIVKQHDGHLEVETEVGRGTTFRLYWPAL